MIESRLSYLFRAYFTKTATSEERDELMELLEQSENDKHIKELITSTWQQFHMQDRVFSDAQGDRMLESVLRKGMENTVPVVKFQKRSLSRISVAAAAAVLCFIAAAGYLWMKPMPFTQPTAQINKTAKDSGTTITPGGNKAVLTLSDGSNIILDSSHEGMLTHQGNTKIIKLSTSTLAYNAGAKESTDTLFNTLTTPVGGLYQVILPDGTSVWLNASSSIHFPTIFSGKERRVTVTGEAYFEVAKDITRPFRITVKDMEVQVLGTHFNIMAYDNEHSINTTLLEGSVKVSRGSVNKLLVPGQESRVSKTGSIKVLEADVDEVIAWKNGWFQFNAYNIEKVMRQISRWYNVEVVYEGKTPSGHFSGLVNRTNNIEQVIKIMQAGGVDCRIEGRKLIVLP